MEARQIRNVTVVGAGLMGSQIATVLAGLGFKVTLADLVIDPDDPFKLVKEALGFMAKKKPQAWMSAGDLARITPAAFDKDTYNARDDLTAALDQADLVIEAVAEDLAIKKGVFGMVSSHVRDGTVLTTNSSGLDLDDIVEVLPESLRPFFMGTHFFNPVLWMRLLEMVPASTTDPELFKDMCSFGEDELGKGVVVAKNSPNYAANVQGVRLMHWVLHNFRRFGLTVDQADTVCNAVGWGKPFDVLDIVGIALDEEVAATTYNGIPDVPDRDVHLPPAYMKEMIERGMLGRATRDKGGFYRMVKGRGGKELLVIDVETLEHKPQEPGDFASLKAAKEAGRKNPLEGLKALLEGDDPAAAFARELVVGQFFFAAHMLGKACDTVYGMDRGVEWGFNHRAGPFAMADGLARVMDEDWLLRQAESLEIGHVPGWYRKMRGVDGSAVYSFYSTDEAGSVAHFMPVFGQEGVDHAIETVPERDAVLTLRDQPCAGEEDVFKGESATVMAYEGVVLVRLHNGRMNPVNAEIIQSLHTAVDYAEEHCLPIVISTNGDNFSAGADLKLLLEQSKADDEAGVREMSSTFQQATWRLRHCSVPVVVGVWGFALGGGCEIALAADRIVAATHLRIGLVEAGVGIIPGAGGTWMFLDRCCQGVPRTPTRGGEAHYQGAMERTRHAFWTLGTGRMCMTAQEARDVGFLRDSDVILPDLDPERVRWTAVQVAMGMTAGYKPPQPRSYPMPGLDGAAWLNLQVSAMVSGGWAHPYSTPIGNHLGAVLTGGDCGKLELVSAERLLQLEQDHFVALAMMPHARECMEHMLRTGKSLLAG